jgi:hypothetical protein
VVAGWRGTIYTLSINRAVEAVVVIGYHSAPPAQARECGKLPMWYNTFI